MNEHQAQAGPWEDEGNGWWKRASRGRNKQGCEGWRVSQADGAREKADSVDEQDADAGGGSREGDGGGGGDRKKKPTRDGSSTQQPNPPGEAWTRIWTLAPQDRASISSTHHQVLSADSGGTLDAVGHYQTIHSTRPVAPHSPSAVWRRLTAMPVPSPTIESE